MSTLSPVFGTSTTGPRPHGRGWNDPTAPPVTAGDLRQPLDGDIHEYRTQQSRGFLLRALQDLLRIRLVCRYCNRRHQPVLPGILIVDLGHSDVAPGSQTVFQALHEAPFV